MIYVFCMTVSVLFFCVETINSMETNASYAEKVKCCRSVIVGSGIEKISRYGAKGVDTVMVKGCYHSDEVAGKCDRIKVNFIQVKDGAAEDVVIKTDDNIASYMRVKQQDNQLKIDFELLNETLKNSKNIEIFIALKRYVRIVTTHCVDTVFSSPIDADDLTITLLSEALMKVPTIQAKKISLEVDDNVVVMAGQEAEKLIADYLFINNKGKAKVDLSIQINFLRVNNDNEGVVELNGSATNQKIVVFNGIFKGKNIIESDKAFIVIGDGAGEVWVRANRLIEGYCSIKSQHDITYTMPYPGIYVRPLDSLQPIDFEKNTELSL